MFTQKCAKPRNPFMYYSAFKLSIYYKNNKSVSMPVHSVECKNTIPQIEYKKITEIVLDRRAGFQFCIDIVNNMTDKIHSAGLYSAYDSAIQYRKFSQGKWQIITEPDFTEENMIVVSKQFSVKNGFAILHDVEANSLAIKPVL